MTTIHVSQIIESAEQAEALPVGTVAVHYPRQGMEDQAAVRVRGGWEFTGTNPDTFDHREAVGMEALIPLDVEVEHLRHTPTGRTKTLYITPWQPDPEPGEDGDALADRTA